MPQAIFPDRGLSLDRQVVVAMGCSWLKLHIPFPSQALIPWGRQLFGSSWAGGCKRTAYLREYHPQLSMALGRLQALGLVKRVGKGSSWGLWQPTAMGLQAARLLQEGLKGQECRKP